MSTFGFFQQNEIGQRGEKLFLSKFPQWTCNNVGKKCKDPDFKDELGRTLELKFDVSARARRDNNGNQLNFFMETISNNTKGTVGGVARAMKEGVTFYVYMFEEPFRIFVLDVEKTKKRVDELVLSNRYRKCRIKNRHYYTEGYPLPIEHFEDCLVSL